MAARKLQKKKRHSLCIHFISSVRVDVGLDQDPAPSPQLPRAESPADSLGPCPSRPVGRLGVGLRTGFRTVARETLHGWALSRRGQRGL